VGCTLIPGLTGATDVGVLALNLEMTSYNPFYQPPVDPISDVVSSQDQGNELKQTLQQETEDLEEEEEKEEEEEEKAASADKEKKEEEKKTGRLICR
jgi:hypothetical protein